MERGFPVLGCFAVAAFVVPGSFFDALVDLLSAIGHKFLFAEEVYEWKCVCQGWIMIEQQGWLRRLYAASS